MLKPRYSLLKMLLMCMVVLSGASHAQPFPSKVVRIVTIEPGGGTDVAARLLAQTLSASFGQPVIVENRGGASGIFAVQAVIKSAPDGHTVLFNSGSTWLLPFLQDNLPYDPVKDLVPITMAIRQPNVLVVHPSLPAKSVKELIALAKARPGQLAYSAGSIGSSTHLSPELFRAMADIDMLHIAYRGGAASLNALLGGHVQVLFTVATAATAHLKSGRMRALAVTSAEPSDVFPGLPTIASSGLPGYESVANYAFFAPLGTPEPLIARLNQEIVRALAVPDVKAKFLVSGVETVGSSPTELASAIKADMAKWGKIIKNAGLRSN